MTELERGLQKIDLATETTKRPISPGAEKWLGEVLPILDNGFVYLVDYMGNDEAIEQAARVSYGRGTRKASETRGLIRYLRRHEHTTPFEMVEFKFHAKMPIFVARQWVRHRTANINEYSARYSILDKEFYIPEPEVLASQSKQNRQGRGEILDPKQAEAVRQLLIADALNSYEHYEYMLNDEGSGKPVDPSRDMVARELARMGLSLNFYTQWYWKIDLHNLFHFLRLRIDKHAQYEIRVYAEGVSRILQDAVPIAWEAFVDYELEAVKLSRPEKVVLIQLLSQKGITFTEDELNRAVESLKITNKREREELVDKFTDLGLISQ
jgi:thymidylate synthase (FAD)